MRENAGGQGNDLNMNFINNTNHYFIMLCASPVFIGSSARSQLISVMQICREYKCILPAWKESRLKLSFAIFQSNRFVLIHNYSIFISLCDCLRASILLDSILGISMQSDSPLELCMGHPHTSVDNLLELPKIF